MIHGLALLIKHDVGEVVIFVDDEIKGKAQLMRHAVDEIELGTCRVCLVHLIDNPLGIIGFVSLYEHIDTTATVFVEVLLKPLDSAACSRVVKIHHLVFVAQRCRVFAHPQIAEQLVKTALHSLVVVGPHHAYKEALAKATGTDEYQRAWLAFQFLQVHRLVDIVQLVFPHRQEVGHSVWYLSYSFHHALRFILPQKYK